LNLPEELRLPTPEGKPGKKKRGEPCCPGRKTWGGEDKLVLAKKREVPEDIKMAEKKRKNPARQHPERHSFEKRGFLQRPVKKTTGKKKRTRFKAEGGLSRVTIAVPRWATTPTPEWEGSARKGPKGGGTGGFVDLIIEKTSRKGKGGKRSPSRPPILSCGKGRTTSGRAALSPL